MQWIRRTNWLHSSDSWTVVWTHGQNANQKYGTINEDERNACQICNWKCFQSISHTHTCATTLLFRTKITTCVMRCSTPSLRSKSGINSKWEKNWLHAHLFHTQKMLGCENWFHWKSCLNWYRRELQSQTLRAMSWAFVAANHLPVENFKLYLGSCWAGERINERKKVMFILIFVVACGNKSDRVCCISG